MNAIRSLSCLLMLPLAAAAQSVVVPNANAGAVGTGQLNTIVRNQGHPRTYQYGVRATELASLPAGAVLTGVSLRFSDSLSNPPSWPGASITWPDYDIFVGPAAPLASWGPDPLGNFTAFPVQVRSGPLVLAADVYSNLQQPGAPNPWGEFYFDFQRPVLYGGGDLAMLFTHPGSNSTGTARFLETVASDAAAHGVAQASNGFYALSTGGTDFYVMRIHYGYGVGCAQANGALPMLVQNADTSGGSGGTILLQVHNAAPSAPVALAFGFAPATVPLGGGCHLLVDPDVLLFAGQTDGSGRLVQSVPVAPGVLGSFRAQAAVLDPGAALGFAVTNGVSPSAL